MDKILYCAQIAMGQLTFTRITAAIIGGCGFMMMKSDAAINYAAAHIMAPGHMAEAFAVAAAAAVVVKFFLPSIFFRAMKERAKHVAVGALLAGLMFHGYSILSAMGLSATGRDEVLSARGDKQEAKARAQAAYNEAVKRVEASAGKLPSATILASITAAEAELRTAVEREASERKTKCADRCDKAVKDGEVAQSKIAALKGDLALSLRAEQAQVDMAEAKARLEAIVAPRHLDPLAAGLATYLPASVETVSKGIPLLPTLVVEFGPGLTLLVAAFLWSLGFPPRAEAVQRPSGGLGIAVRAPDPIKPLALPPVKLSPEEEAYKKLSTHIVASGSPSPASVRYNAALLELPASTVHTYLRKWDKNGKIVKQVVGGKNMIGLPLRAELTVKRAMQMA